MLNNPKVKYVKISRRHFDIITPKDNNTIYFIEENSGELTLNLGDSQITVGRFSNDELLGLVEGKQDKLVAGGNITINPDTNVISSRNDEPDGVTILLNEEGKLKVSKNLEIDGGTFV